MGGEDRQLAVLEAGCLGRMAALVGHGREEVAAKAMEACKALAQGQWGALSVASSAVLQHAAVVMRMAPDCSTSLCASACTLVRVLVGSGQLAAVLRADCRAGLQRRAGSSHCGEACWALASACSMGSAEQGQWLVDRGVLGTFRACMARGQYLGAQLAVVQALEVLLQRSKQGGRRPGRGGMGRGARLTDCMLKDAGIQQK